MGSAGPVWWQGEIPFIPANRNAGRERERTLGESLAVSGQQDATTRSFHGQMTVLAARPRR